MLFKNTLFIAIMCSFVLAYSVYADDDLMVLAERGDVVALQKMRSLAEQGDIGAQSGLGYMYKFGFGVAKDYSEAAKWYRKAAEQNHPDSEYQLAFMYAFGEGNPKDYVTAYMWAELAVAQHNVKGMQLHDKLEKVMTPEQIAEGKRLSREWAKKHKKG